MSKPKPKFDTKKEIDPAKLSSLSKKKFHPKDIIPVVPMTTNQQEFLSAYFSQCQIILQDGCAGVGKSFLALYAALTEVLDTSTPYERIIIIRSTVDTRPIGFVPGTEEEKIARYEKPYRDMIKQLIIYNDSYDNMKALGYIQFEHSGNLRGMTFDNAIMIVDEAQNMDQPELLGVLTRAGENTKIVICGDIKQNDLFRQRFDSGFVYLRKLMNIMPSSVVSTITYGTQDIVRSGLVKMILEADNQL